MSRILILTLPTDYHAHAIGEALRLKGAEVDLWFGTSFPTRQEMLVEVGQGGKSWSLADPTLDRSDTEYRTVWNRRPTLPMIPDYLHEADRQIAIDSCQHMVTAMWLTVGRDAFWVNPYRSDAASLKPVQLQAAAEVGLQVPETVFTNDPQRVKDFLRQYRGQTVFKGFRSASWKTEDGVAVGYTAPVTEQDLPGDEMLRAVPGIYQRAVPKSHELRIVAMGEHLVTAKVLSQETSGAERDWRAVRSPKMEAGELPSEVEAGCRRLMQRLGIVFGCFDFIVTPEGDHVFLEVNQMGQFLFVERLCPELQLLDRFATFLMAGKEDFEWPDRPDRLRLEDVRESALAAREAACKVHVNPIPQANVES